MSWFKDSNHTPLLPSMKKAWIYTCRIIESRIIEIAVYCHQILQAPLYTNIKQERWLIESFNYHCHFCVGGHCYVHNCS